MRFRKPTTHAFRRKNPSLLAKTRLI